MLFRYLPLIVAIFAGPALADPPAPAPAAAASPAPAAKPKLTCRSEAVTGSIVKHRTCHTDADWAAIDKAEDPNAQRLMDGTRSHGAGSL